MLNFDFQTCLIVCFFLEKLSTFIKTAFRVTEVRRFMILNVTIDQNLCYFKEYDMLYGHPWYGSYIL